MTTQRMRPRPPPMDPRTYELLKLTAKALEPLAKPYSIGGAVAMGAHGVRRYTTDVDVFALDADRNRILHALRSAGLEISAVFEPFHYFAYLPRHADPEIRVDVLFPAGEPELSAVEYPVRAKIGSVEVNVFPRNLLVATKFYSDRLKDELDIAMMYTSGVFDPEAVRAIIASFDPEGAVDFAALIARLAKARPPRRRPPVRR